MSTYSDNTPIIFSEFSPSFTPCLLHPAYHLNGFCKFHLAHIDSQDKSHSNGKRNTLKSSLVNVQGARENVLFLIAKRDFVLRVLPF